MQVVQLSPRRYRTPGLVGAAAVALLLAGCSGTTTPEPTGPGTATPSGTELTISVDDGAGNLAQFTLSCDPPAGTHPDPPGACALVTADPSIFDPPPTEGACTSQYGGPQTAHVTGTVNGAAVDATYHRRDGCGIARWDATVPLLEP